MMRRIYLSKNRFHCDISKPTELYSADIKLPIALIMQRLIDAEKKRGKILATTHRRLVKEKALEIWKQSLESTPHGKQVKI